MEMEWNVRGKKSRGNIVKEYFPAKEELRCKIGFQLKKKTKKNFVLGLGNPGPVDKIF